LQALLPTTRLMTLVGVGGAGKTRLSLELAAQAADSFPDGIWLAELAALSDPLLVPQRVGLALELRDGSGRPSQLVLADYLRERHLLLILDNCEHLIEACAALVEHLLSTCPELTILATSREALGITGELAWRVPPLSMPGSAGDPSMQHLAGYEAVQLFVARAASVEPGLVLSDEHAPAIAEVCRRLDGMPLALELAAARLRTLAPQQIAERLQDRFALLVGGSRTAQPRHQTLRATLDWSYDLLSQSEQLIFDRASVFSHGWTLQSAEDVCAGGGIQPSDVLGLLTSLVDKSLVQADPGTHAEVRFSQLETIRQYALSRLAERGAIETTRRRHANHFLAETERGAAELRGPQPQQRHRLWSLDREHDNLRAALGWAIEGGDVQLGLRLAAALADFWYRRGYIGEGRRWLERALQQAPDAPAELRAAAWYGAGKLARFVVSDIAEGYFSKSLELSRQLGDTRAVAESLAGLGSARAASSASFELNAALDELAAGEHASALDFQLGLSSQLNGVQSIWTSGFGPRRVLNRTHPRPGAAERFDSLDRRSPPDEQVEAEALLDEGLELFRTLEDSWGIAACLSGMGNLAFVRGEYSRAAMVMGEGLTLARVHGDAWQIAYLLHGLGHICWLLSDRQRSLALLAEGLALCSEVDIRPVAANCIQSVALMAGSQGMWQQAARLWGVAATTRHAAGLKLWGQPWIRSPEGMTPFEAVATTRAGLGEAAFGAAWAAGGALSLAEAVQEATALCAVLSRQHQPKQESLDPLTRRERQVADLVAEGFTNRQIGAALVITEGTAALHVKHVLAKLGFSSRAQIAAWATRHELQPQISMV